MLFIMHFPTVKQRRKSLNKLAIEISSYLADRNESQTHLSNRYKEYKGSETTITQPQLSKILSGKITRYSKHFDELCAFCGIDLFERIVENTIGRAVLEDCLAEVWDGSEKHARQLAKLLRQVGTLTGNR